MRFEERGSARQSRFSAVSGLIAGLGTLLSLIGFLVAPPVGITMFITTWVILLGRGLFQFFSNVFGDKGVTHEISEFSGRASEATDAEKPAFAEKMGNLQALKDDGLITNQEYEQKRAEILGEKW
jgi:hypothetical protein